MSDDYYINCEQQLKYINCEQQLKRSLRNIESSFSPEVFKYCLEKLQKSGHNLSFEKPTPEKKYAVCRFDGSLIHDIKTNSPWFPSRQEAEMRTKEINDCYSTPEAWVVECNFKVLDAPK